jgi:hypothetical protein
MICSLEILTLDTWDVVDLVLYAAEKYDMLSPASIVLALLCTPTFVDAPCGSRGGIQRNREHIQRNREHR